MPMYDAAYYAKLPSKRQVHFCYILQCEGGKRYCGMTANVIDRLTAHMTKRGAKFTRGFAPIDLLHVERVSTYTEAIQREIELKRMMRKGINFEYKIVHKYRWLFGIIRELLKEYDGPYIKKYLNDIERMGLEAI